MPEFYLIPKRLARKAPALSSAAQWVEAAVFRFIFWLMRKLSLGLALRLSAFTFGLGSAYSDKADKARANFRYWDSLPDHSRPCTYRVGLCAQSVLFDGCATFVVGFLSLRKAYPIRYPHSRLRVHQK